MASVERIAVLGGTGFVGGHLVRRLSGDGHQVRVLSRRPHRHRELDLLPNVELVQCNPFDSRALRRSLTDCSVVINLVGILNESYHQTFRRVHVALPARIVEASKTLGISRMLHMSALNADSGAPSRYLRSKGEGENLIHTTSGGRLAVTSFRPSVIFGPGDSFLNRFAGLVRWMPGVMPLACAASVLSPVYVGDVVDAMVGAMNDRQTFGKRIELCGPREYLLKELVGLAARYSGQSSRILSLPRWASKTQAIVMGSLPGRLFTLDNYHSLRVPSVCRERQQGRTPIEAVAPLYLGSLDHEARMQVYRERIEGNSAQDDPF